MSRACALLTSSHHSLPWPDPGNREQLGAWVPELVQGTMVALESMHVEQQAPFDGVDEGDGVHCWVEQRMMPHRIAATRQGSSFLPTAKTNAQP